MCVCFYCEFGRCCFEMFGIGFPEMDISRYVWTLQFLLCAFNYPVWIRDRKEMDRKLDFWQAWLITDPTVVWLNQSCWYDFVCLKGVKCQSHFPNFGGLGWIILWGTDVCCLHVILALWGYVCDAMIMSERWSRKVKQCFLCLFGSSFFCQLNMHCTSFPGRICSFQVSVDRLWIHRCWGKTRACWNGVNETKYSKAPSIENSLLVVWSGLQRLWRNMYNLEHFEIWFVRVWQCFNQSKVYWTLSWIWLGVKLFIHFFCASCQSPIESNCQSTHRHLIHSKAPGQFSSNRNPWWFLGIIPTWSTCWNVNKGITHDATISFNVCMCKLVFHINDACGVMINLAELYMGDADSSKLDVRSKMFQTCKTII